MYLEDIASAVHGFQLYLLAAGANPAGPTLAFFSSRMMI